MVICLEQCADMHMAQLMPLPLTVSCFSKIQIGFTFLVLAHTGSPRRRAVKQVHVCMSKCVSWQPWFRKYLLAKCPCDGTKTMFQKRKTPNSGSYSDVV